MSMFMLAAVQAVDEGLTAREVLSSLPFDPFSIFAMILLAGAFAAVVYFGTRPWMAPGDAPLEGESGGGAGSGSGEDRSSRQEDPKQGRNAA